MNYFQVIPHDILLHIIKIGRINYEDFLRFAISTKTILSRCLAYNQKIFRLRLLEDFEINVDLVDNLGRKIANLPEEEQTGARLNKPDAYKLYCRLMRTYFKDGKGFRKDRATVLLIDARCPVKVSERFNNPPHVPDNLDTDEDVEDNLDTGEHIEDNLDNGEHTEDKLDNDDCDEDEYVSDDHAFSHNFGSPDDQALSLAILEYKYPDIRLFLRRGDILEDIFNSGYRSNGICFWDGDNVIDQNYDYDDNGSAPAQFLVFGQNSNPQNDSGQNSNSQNDHSFANIDKEGFSPHYWDKPFTRAHELNICTAFTDIRESDFYWHDDSAPFCIDMSLIKKEVEANRIFRQTISCSFGNAACYYFVKIRFDEIEYKVMLELPMENNLADEKDFSDEAGRKYFARLFEISLSQKYTMRIYADIDSDGSVYLSLSPELQREIFQ